MESVEQHVDPSYLIGSNPIRLLYVSEPMRVWPVVGANELLVAVAPKEYDAMSVIDVGRSLQKVRHGPLQPKGPIIAITCLR